MVKSANRVIQILNAVGASNTGMKNAELSAALNIPKGSLSLLLSELVEHDFLALRKEDRRYILGPQIIALAGHYLNELDIVQVGRPVIHEVVKKTDESSALAVKHGFEILIVYGENSSQPLKRSIEIGYRAPLYTTAGGKAILAYLSDKEIEQYLSTVKLTPKTRSTITHQEALLKKLRAIRSKGLAHSREEQYEGLTAMAAPFFDLHGVVAGAIVVTLPTFRFNAKKEKLLKNALYQASEALSNKLGFNATSRRSRRGMM